MCLFHFYTLLFSVFQTLYTFFSLTEYKDDLDKDLIEEWKKEAAEDAGNESEAKRMDKKIVKDLERLGVEFGDKKLITATGNSDVSGTWKTLEDTPIMVKIF